MDRLAPRGYLVLLVGSQTSTSRYPCGHCCVLDFVSKSSATVARSSFAAELCNTLEAARGG
eukprot:4388954-Prorocentrum_lima.AAC.1